MTKNTVLAWNYRLSWTLLNQVAGFPFRKKNPIVFPLQFFPMGSSEISGILYILCGSHIYLSLLSELSLLKLLNLLSHAQCLWLTWMLQIYSLSRRKRNVHYMFIMNVQILIKIKAFFFFFLRCFLHWWQMLKIKVCELRESHWGQGIGTSILYLACAVSQFCIKVNSNFPQPFFLIGNVTAWIIPAVAWLRHWEVVIKY